MTAMDTEDITILEMIEQHDIVCDYAETHKSCSQGPAKWIARCKCIDCGHAANRLICTPCKDAVMSTDSGVYCPRCESVVVPARHAYTSIEPL